MEVFGVQSTRHGNHCKIRYTSHAASVFSSLFHELEIVSSSCLLSLSHFVWFEQIIRIRHGHEKHEESNKMAIFSDKVGADGIAMMVQSLNVNSIDRNTEVNKYFFII